MEGIVKKVFADKGFCFITPNDGGKDLFCHFSGMAGKNEAFDSLAEGMTVSFEVQDGQKGPMAVNVEVIG